MKVDDFIFNSDGDYRFAYGIEHIRGSILKALQIPPEKLEASVDLPTGINKPQVFTGARGVLKIGGQIVGMFGPVMEGIQALDSTDCKHVNVQEVLLLNFTVKHCKDCGREVK